MYFGLMSSVVHKCAWCLFVHKISHRYISPYLFQINKNFSLKCVSQKWSIVNVNLESLNLCLLFSPRICIGLIRGG